MIYIFQGVQEICALPGKACGACSKCLEECEPQLREACAPCSEACESCSTSCTDFLNRPLGGYVAMASWLSLLELGMCACSLQYSEPPTANASASKGEVYLNGCVIPAELSPGPDVGIFNWLYLQMALAAIHMLFAFYVQTRLWSRLTEAGGVQPGSRPDAGALVVSQSVVKDSFVHVFLHDIGVCIYFFTLIFSFVWSYWGSAWASSEPACNPESWPSTAASLGMFFFWFVLTYASGWYCYMECLSAGEGLVLRRGPVARAHPVPAGGAVYQRPDAAAAARDGQSDGQKAGGILGGLLGTRNAADGTRPAGDGFDAAEPSAPPVARATTGWERACQRRQLAKLLACISLDLFGSASYLLPMVGEGLDLAFAPAQAIALKMLFDANGLMCLGLTEELLPFTDIIPTATMGWWLETFAPESKVAVALGIHAD